MASGLNYTKGENITGSINFLSAIAKAIASQDKNQFLSDATSAAEKKYWE